MLLYGAVILAFGLVIGRPYCRYLCPYGAILRVLSLLSKWRLSIPPGECINCQLCEEVCPYGAIHPPTTVPDVKAQAQGRRRLVVTLLAFPCLVILFAWLGSQLAVPLSQWNPQVRLAELVRLRQTGGNLDSLQDTEQATDAVEAFRGTRQSSDRLAEAAISLRERFIQLGGWLGAWIGLVLGIKLIHLNIRRRRDDYQAERTGCVSCGRCYWYCPVEQVRLGLIDDVSELVPSDQLQ